jgi:hypothetical protein
MAVFFWRIDAIEYLLNGSTGNCVGKEIFF